MAEFIGFTFCGIHSSKYGVYAISNGGTYTLPLFAEFTDNTENVDGMDGEYYFGTSYNSKPRNVECVCDRADENTLRSIQNWLNPKRMGKLTFDESPYKYYIAKVTNKPDLNYYPTTDEFTGHVYNGMLSITFTAYDPLAYSYVGSLDDRIYYEESLSPLYYDSGIIHADETPPARYENITSNKTILLFNGGSAKSPVNIRVFGSAETLNIANLTTNQSFSINGLENAEIEINAQKGQISIGGVSATSFHSGGYIELEGNSRTDIYGDINFTNGSNQITIPEDIDLDIVGRFIAVNNEWYKIIDCDFMSGLITFDKNFNGTTDIYNITILDLNEISLSGTGLNIISIEFDYFYRYL